MTSLHELLPPVSAGTLGHLLDLDPHAAPDAAITPEPTQ